MSREALKAGHALWCLAVKVRGSEEKSGEEKGAVESYIEDGWDSSPSFVSLSIVRFRDLGHALCERLLLWEFMWLGKCGKMEEPFHYQVSTTHLSPYFFTLLDISHP